jgi:hypothetical protein
MRVHGFESFKHSLSQVSKIILSDCDVAFVICIVKVMISECILDLCPRGSYNIVVELSRIGDLHQHLNIALMLTHLLQLESD